jgi:hypothetical protein
MSKGKLTKVGEEHVNANGYTMVKTSTGWRLKHHLVAEEILKRPLTEQERVSFKDNDRTNFSPDNIIVAIKRKPGSAAHTRRLVRIEELMTALVEDSSDKWEALKDLEDAIGNVRSLYGFSAKL